MQELRLSIIATIDSIPIDMLVHVWHEWDIASQKLQLQSPEHQELQGKSDQQLRRRSHDIDHGRLTATDYIVTADSKPNQLSPF